MNKAIFLDRDGVIISDDGLYYITNPYDIKINPGITELLSWLQSEGYLLIVISNQGGIARGIYTFSDTERVHSRLLDLLKDHRIKLDEIYYCPHHPEIEKCICRKPDTVLIEKAISRFNIDAGKSFFIGDRETDMEAAKNAGIEGILVNANQDMSLVKEIIKDKKGTS
ncbi:MAG: HAD family hydrolase [Bacteroidales bacterium]|nr:HAD family hydrolase [Bacteroidales bacterium]MCB8999741.1 HAD family hydrolase [Bacteroidales bacterium]MCB9013449.1 HAD family hydrolase [Bacteroidales bacterium]